MKRFSACFTFALLALAPAVLAQGPPPLPPLPNGYCTIDAVPAATLLLPYFEVDIDNPGGVDTFFSINNASQLQRADPRHRVDRHVGRGARLQRLPHRLRRPDDRHGPDHPRRRPAAHQPDRLGQPARPVLGAASVGRDLSGLRRRPAVHQSGARRRVPRAPAVDPHRRPVVDLRRPLRWLSTTATTSPAATSRSTSSATARC